MVIGNPGILPGLVEFFRADRTGMPLKGAQTLLQTVLLGGVCPFQEGVQAIRPVAASRCWT